MELWWTYGTSYVPSEGTANERDKEIYNYILCAVSHLADLYLYDSKVNIADSRAKNSWGLIHILIINVTGADWCLTVPGISVICSI